MKKKSFTFCLVPFLVMLFITSGCRVTSYQEEKPNKDRYVDITIHDIGKKFKASEVKAILFTDWPIIEESGSIQVLGNVGEVEKIRGRKLKARVFCALDDPNWLNKITQDFFEEAKRTPIGYYRGYLDDARAIFITKDKDYRLKISSDDKFFYGPDFESKLLKEHLKEIGFEPEEYPPAQSEGMFGPSLEIGFPLCEGKTIDDIRKELNASDVDTILLTDWFKIEEAKTVIVLGNLSKAESIIGREIKAQKVVNDPLLVGRITKDFLEAEHTEKDYLPLDYRNIFITTLFITKDDKCYRIKISADNKDKVVHSRGYKSEQLWKDLEMVGFTGIE